MTYIYQKDSTLWAFEGPEEPKWPKHYKENDDFEMAKAYYAAMSTARESALPVVNAVVEYALDVPYTWIDDTKCAHPLKPSEPVALPGWALEKEPLWDDYRKRPSAQNVYRLVRSEPDGIEMNHAVVDEFTKPIPIKLTFKSGILWYGEYEVVNPEVIPGYFIFTDGTLAKPNAYNVPVSFNDGDQITLPDGYGIKERKYRQRGEVNGPERREATITLPEKPDNSAHGYTEGADIPEPEKPENSAYGCPKCRTTDFNSCHSMYCPMRKESVVEPSESQEEIHDMWMEVCVETYAVEIIGVSKVIKKLKEKFTITRK